MLKEQREFAGSRICPRNQALEKSPQSDILLRLKELRRAVKQSDARSINGAFEELQIYFRKTVDCFSWENYRLYKKLFLATASFLELQNPTLYILPKNRYALQITRIATNVRKISVANKEVMLFSKGKDFWVDGQGNYYGEFVAADRKEVFMCKLDGQKKFAWECPNVVALRNLFHDTSALVTNLILYESDNGVRNLLYVSLVDLAYYAVQRRNFATAAAIYNGINEIAVRRLYFISIAEDAWVPRNILPKDTTKKFFKVRSKLAEKHEKSCLPDFNLVIQDFILEYKNSHEKNHRKNYGRYREKYGKMIASYRDPGKQCRVHCDLKPSFSGDVEKWCARSRKIYTESRDSFFKQSFAIFSSVPSLAKSIMVLPLAVVDIYLAEILGQKFSTLLAAQETKEVSYDGVKNFLYAMGKYSLPPRNTICLMLISLGVDSSKLDGRYLRTVKLKIYLSRIKDGILRELLLNNLQRDYNFDTKKYGSTAKLIEQLNLAMDIHNSVKAMEIIGKLGFSNAVINRVGVFLAEKSF